MAFSIRLLGVRGSIPVPDGPKQIQRKIEEAIKAFLVAGHREPSEACEFMNRYPIHLGGGFGNNSTSIEVQSKKKKIYIDCGSGLKKVVKDLMAGPCGRGQGQVHILLTHFHLDRLIALPFFSPLFVKGNEIHFYAVQEELRSVIEKVFSRPFCPVPFEALAADVYLHRLNPRQQVEINDFAVTPYQLDHPDPCWGFKVQKNGLVYSHCVDTELVRVTDQALGEDLALFKDVDLMLFDAQYSVRELTEKVNWGHATANFGIDIALKHNVKKILFVNHDSSLNDLNIKEMFAEVKKYYERLVGQLNENDASFSPTRWAFAQEDRVIEVGSE